MRLLSNKRLGYFVDIDQTGQGLIIHNEREEVILTLSVDDVLDSVLEPSSLPSFQRAEPRVNLAVRLRYSFQQGQVNEGITGNIGGGGVFIETTSPPAVGTHVDLELILPTKENEPIHAMGEIVWIRMKPERIVYFPGMSVRFDKISPDDKDLIRDLAENISKARYGAPST